MMNFGHFLKVAAVLLLVNISVVILVNLLFLMRSPAAVKQKLISFQEVEREEKAADAAQDYVANQDALYDVKDGPNIVFDVDLSVGSWDKSRVFKSHSYIVKADKWDQLSKWNICLSSQCSVNLLFWVVEQVKTWKGPMSVAVFAPDMDYIVAKLMIQYMRLCFPAVRDQVSFHLVYPGIMAPVLNASKLLEYDCTRPEAVNNDLVKIFRTQELLKILEMSRYPQNLLRNIARQACPSSYCFTPDIDMISIPGMSEQLNELCSRPEVSSCNKCAYVIPTYEISIKAPKNPTNKEELLKLRRKLLAQEFHVKVFKNNQANSNLSYWEKISHNPDTLNVAYNVTTWMRHWEPIYVTHSKVPPFDERFIGYGFTRNSQVYEMRLAGYSWLMLDGAFLTHRGFQTKRTHNKSRRKQIAENNGRYNVFVRELYERYHVKLSDKDESEKPSSKMAEASLKLKDFQAALKARRINKYKKPNSNPT